MFAKDTLVATPQGVGTVNAVGGKFLWVFFPTPGDPDDLGRLKEFAAEDVRPLACVECGEPAVHLLACRAPVCDDCFERYQSLCGNCEGWAAWCLFAGHGLE